MRRGVGAGLCLVTAMVGVVLLMALALGLLTSLVFTAYSYHTGSLSISLALLPPVVTVVIMLVNGNVGAGLAVAGTFAAVGFLVAGLVGVPLALYGIKKGWAVAEDSKGLPRALLRGLRDEGDRPACAYSTTHPANIDSLGFHMGVMAATYGAAYVFGVIWTMFAPAALKAFGFGMMFLWGMLVDMGIRKFMVARHIDNLLDNETCHRITNMTVDFMICAVFMGIRLSSLQDVLIPFIIAIILGSILTFVLCLWFGRRSPEYGFERCLALFGYCTGTAASGLLLLRIADPELRTPVAVKETLLP